jgi:hypothetical protein
MRSFWRIGRDGAVVAGAVLGLAVATRPARALESCNGQYSAAALQPLPVPTVVKLDLRDSSPVNINLAKAFTTGMQQAGLHVDGPPTVKLSLMFSIIGQGGSTGPGAVPPGGASADGNYASGTNAPWLNGGYTAQLPDLPRYDLFTPQQPAQSALLILRVEANDPSTGTTDWIGSIQCTLLGNDNQTLAFQLGYRIGGTLGKRVDNGPL